VEKSSRTTAFLAYLLPVMGPLLILLFGRKHLLATYHACQSLAIVIAALLAPLVWVVLSWALSWIPLLGPILFASLFALVLATWVFAFITFLLGMSSALRGDFRRVPLFGQWGEQLFLRLHADEEIVAPQDGHEAVV
jgi:uncharacterized membrane protein